MIRYILAPGVQLYILPIKCVYLHRVSALELGWLDDDLGQDASSRIVSGRSEGPDPSSPKPR